MDFVETRGDVHGDRTVVFNFNDLAKPLLTAKGVPHVMFRFIAIFITLFSTACSAQTNGPDNDVVLVAGATGRTGQHIVRQLVDEGYRVRALGRDGDKVRAMFGDSVEVAVGDVTDPASLKPAFDGVMLVVSAIGSSAKEGPGSPEFVDYGGNNNLVDAAVAVNVDQFVLVSSMGVTHPTHPLNKMLGNVLIWKLKNEDYLRASGLDYTVVRPGGLHDKAGGDQFIVLEQGDEWKVVAIARADVAEICVAALQTPEARNKTFEVFSVKEAPDRNWQQKFASLQ